MKKSTSILFVCSKNSVRSQMAEGLAKLIFGKRAKVGSAGSKPSGSVHPLAIAVLQEIGVDISKNSSKSVGQIMPEFFDGLDYIIILCDDEVCPAVAANAVNLHWPFQDPTLAVEDQKLEAFRTIRDLLLRRLLLFYSEVV
jgi:arsenate reductase